MQEIVTKLILELQQNIADNAGTIDYERYEAELLSVLQNLQQCNVSGALQPVDFADMLLMDFEISTFDNGDLCWQLAGTKQNYTSAQIYKKLCGNDR